MSNDFLLREACEQLAAAQTNPAVRAYTEGLPLSPIWLQNAVAKRAALAAASFDAALAALQTMLFVHSRSADEAALAVRWNLRQPFAAAAPEASAFAPEDSVVRIGGRRYWHDDFRHHGFLRRMTAALAGETPARILELGAGCGNLARLIKLAWPGVRYTIVDLPDTLVFAGMFLRANFPEARVCFLTDESAAGELTAADFALVPAGLEHVLAGQSFDAFINTASLGEMRRETVEYWFDFVQRRVQARRIFSCNRLLNTVLLDGGHDWRRGENGHAFAFDATWRIDDFELEPDFLRCPWQNRHARQALIFGARIAAPEPFAPAADAALMARVASWNQPPHDMTAQDVALAADFTRDGVLFALWNAHRLAPGTGERAAAAADLRQYLDYLCGRGDRCFEEAWHLEAA